MIGEAAQEFSSNGLVPPDDMSRQGPLPVRDEPLHSGEAGPRRAPAHHVLMKSQMMAATMAGSVL